MTIEETGPLHCRVSGGVFLCRLGSTESAMWPKYGERPPEDPPGRVGTWTASSPFERRSRAPAVMPGERSVEALGDGAEKTAFLADPTACPACLSALTFFRDQAAAQERTANAYTPKLTAYLRERFPHEVDKIPGETSAAFLR